MVDSVTSAPASHATGAHTVSTRAPPVAVSAHKTHSLELAHPLAQHAQEARSPLLDPLAAWLASRALSRPPVDHVSPAQLASRRLPLSSNVLHVTWAPSLMQAHLLAPLAPQARTLTYQEPLSAPPAMLASTQPAWDPRPQAVVRTARWASLHGLPSPPAACASQGR